jgi:hypothetical protein
LITTLAAKYEEIQKDGQLLSNKAAVELIDLRVRQLANRIDQNDAPDRLKQIDKAWGEFKFALGSKNKEAIKNARRQMDYLIYAARHDYASWEQMIKALDLRSKMVEREVKIYKEMKAIMTAEDGMELAAKLYAAAKNVILSDDFEGLPKSIKLKKLEYEFTRIIGAGSNWEDEGGPGNDPTSRSTDLDGIEILHP